MEAYQDQFHPPPCTSAKVDGQPCEGSRSAKDARLSSLLFAHGHGYPMASSDLEELGRSVLYIGAAYMTHHHLSDKDLLQEIALRVFCKSHLFDPLKCRRPANWVCSVARTVAIAAIRKGQREGRRLELLSVVAEMADAIFVHAPEADFEGSGPSPGLGSPGTSHPPSR